MLAVCPASVCTAAAAILKNSSGGAGIATEAVPLSAPRHTVPRIAASVCALPRRHASSDVL